MTDKSASDTPKDILSYVLQELVEIKATLAVQEAQLISQERLILATTLALPQEQRVAYLELAVALQLNTLAEGDAHAAKLMNGQVARWREMCGEALEVEPAQQLLALHAQTLMLADTPKHLKSAQQQWLSIATPEEIAQELSERLQLGSKPAAESALSKKARDLAARGKKKPKGD